MTISRVFGLGLLLSSLGLGGLGYGRQEIPQKLAANPLERQVPFSGVELQSTKSAFQWAVGATRAPAGVASVDACEEASKREFRSVGQRLGEAMDDLVNADPTFRWEMDDGVINLLPAGGEPGLLKTQIPAFDRENLTSVAGAMEKVVQTPEVKEAMIEMHLEWGLNLISKLFSPHPKEFSVHFKGGTVREALNTIARAEGSSVWEYTERLCDGKHEVWISF